ncbi:MAG: AAA family ATPase, partial [Bacilli bacterium]
MLLECSIKNFAIISSLQVPFQSGLNILTGETGAGKSIIIDALGLLLGGRGSTEYVRHGSDKAELEALFELEPQSPLHQLLQELGLPVDDDHTLIVRREINIHGKSICRINGQMVTLSTLKEIGAGLVNIHGQHEHQSLLQPERHIDWIDAYGGQSITSAKAEFQAIYRPYQELKRLLKELSTHEQSSAQRLDLLQFQLNEIVAASLEPGEDVRLSEERKRLSNAEKLFQNIASGYDMLYGDHKGLDCISYAVSYVESASKYDDRLLPVLELLQTASYQLEEVTTELRDYRDSIEFNADGLISIEKRLDLIQSLRKKYGQSVDAILEYAATIEDELDVIQNKDERLEKIEKQLQE